MPHAEKRIRSFLALELPSEVKEEIASFAREVKGNLPQFRFIPPKNLHITLHFLGEVEPAKLAGVSSGLKEALKAACPFQFHLEGVGCFPNDRAPRVLWIGLEGDLEAFRSLKRVIDQELIRLHFPVESKPFIPHLTVARAKARTRTPSVKKVLQFKSKHTVSVREVAWLQSLLSPQGSTYSLLGVFPLGAS